MGHRSFFGSDNNIRDCHASEWVHLERCVWDGPDFLVSKTVLKRSYGDNPLLQHFFTTALRVSNCNIEDVVAEIESRRDDPKTNTDLPLARTIYKVLGMSAKSEEDWENLK